MTNFTFSILFTNLPGFVTLSHGFDLCFPDYEIVGLSYHITIGHVNLPFVKNPFKIPRILILIGSWCYLLMIICVANTLAHLEYGMLFHSFTASIEKYKFLKFINVLIWLAFCVP